MFDNKNTPGLKEFDFESLLRSLEKASAWQLKLRLCFEPNICAHDLSLEWTCSGKPVAGGYFLFKNKNILVYIPHAVSPEKVLHSLVVYKAQEWKRDCERCRFAGPAIIEEYGDHESRFNIHEPVSPVDSVEMLTQLRLIEEVFGEITNETTRQIFEMRYLQQCSDKEIAEKVGKTVVNVRQIICREKKRLSAIFVPISLTAS